VGRERKGRDDRDEVDCKTRHRSPDLNPTHAPIDRTRIFSEHDSDLRWWSDALNIPMDRLTATIQKVGPMVEAVRRELRQPK
jgi:hypothetical protein